MAAVLELLIIPALLALVVIGTGLVLDFSLGTAIAAAFAIAIVVGVGVGLLRYEHHEDLEDTESLP